MQIEITHPVYEKAKAHFEKHKLLYCCLGAGLLGAGITTLVMRGVASQHISRGISVTAEGGIAVLGKNVVMDNVSYISAERQGPPSWVIRCIETGNIFTSQASAATEMDLSASEISKHLNGVRDHVRGFTFERICLAA
jgi:hypothetical protein